MIIARLVALILLLGAIPASAQVQPTTSSTVEVGPAIPRVTFAAGVTYIGGTLKFNEDFGPPAKLVSRLTFQMPTRSIEMFGRLDISRLFFGGKIGLGTVPSGQMHDEDWAQSIYDFPYSNTLSKIGGGTISTATVDAGFILLKKEKRKIGFFLGYSYYAQRTDQYGCAQLVDVEHDSCTLYYSDVEPLGSTLTSIVNSSWNSMRVGATAESKLTKHWKVGGEVAYLPAVRLIARDNHLFRSDTTWFDEKGYGSGLQTEATATYLVNNHFSISGGWSYWSLKADGLASCTSNGYSGCQEGSKAGVATAPGGPDKFGIKKSDFLVRFTGKF